MGKRSEASIKVLVIDDDQGCLDVMSNFLKMAGYHVTGIPDPTAAIDHLKKDNYHVAVLDIQMDPIDGVALLREIRQHDRDVGVILITAFGSLETAREAVRLHADDYLLKDEVEKLPGAVAKILKKKGVLIDPEVQLHQNIGTTIRQRRSELELTLRHLARRSGLSVSLISQIERAESSASVSSLFKIARALGLNMADLFGEF